MQAEDVYLARLFEATFAQSGRFQLSVAKGAREQWAITYKSDVRTLKVTMTFADRDPNVVQISSAGDYTPEQINRIMKTIQVGGPTVCKYNEIAGCFLQVLRISDILEPPEVADALGGRGIA